MSSNEHREFCEKLGNPNYDLSTKTKESQDNFFDRQLGISIEEVLNMEPDKLDRLIENKRGVKIGYDKNIKIDGCSLVKFEDIENR